VNAATFRTSIETLLTATFPSAKIVAGERLAATVRRDKDYACVFTGPVKPVPSNVNNANVSLTIRYWKAHPKLGAQLRDVPSDPAPLEALEASLAAMLKPVIASTAGVDYFHVESISNDPNDEYGVEVVCTGWGRNPAEAGG